MATTTSAPVHVPSLLKVALHRDDDWSSVTLRIAAHADVFRRTVAMLYRGSNAILGRLCKLSTFAHEIRSSHLDLLKVAPTHYGNTPNQHDRPPPGFQPLDGQAFGAKSALGTGS